MEGSNLVTKILQDTPFKHGCNIYKENSIPILKDHNISDQCREIGKQLLNMTKNPLSQHVDVLIPKLDRNDYTKSQMEHFKSFFGHKYLEKQQQQTTESNGFMQESIDNTIPSINACISKCKTTRLIEEFIDTEQNYVDIMEDFVENFMKPIRESIADPNLASILDQYSFNKIFINYEDILDVNKSFLASLKQYQNGSGSETLGQILLNHIDTFHCYRIFLLGKTSSSDCVKQNKKENKLFHRFLINCNLRNNKGPGDALIEPVQRISRYSLMLNNIVNTMHPNDSDIRNIKMAITKVFNINDMRYGSDYSLLNLYHLIREAPTSLIKTRKLLGYFDATELSLLTGKTNRPVTILVFTDKIMVVKRKNASLQSKEYLKNIEEKIKTGSNTILQKAREVVTGGLPLEFKGWADIKTVEIFDGLKDRPDTFFLRTCLPELNPNATEKECESYFRRSDRLYSIAPNATKLGSYTARKQEFITLCQRQLAISKLEDNIELYHEDKLKLPAYSLIYDQDSYSKATHKNNILIVYVEHNYESAKIDLNTLLTDDVWIVILLTHHETGYKATIRSRTNLIPIREISREIEYESIVFKSKAQKDENAPLDFIDTLWNNLFFYERRLRATEAYSCINDDLLRDRARSRSRSKSLTRVASNMSIGKLFARSRSTSPSRHSSSNERADDDDDQTASVASCVPDPILEIATVNKQTENVFRGQYNSPPTLSHKTYSGPGAANTHYADKGHKPSRINTQPSYQHTTNDTKSSFLTEIFVRDDKSFNDTFNNGLKQDDCFSTVGSTNYQDNSNRCPSYNHRNSVSMVGTNNSDLFLYQSSPELIRPSSGGSNNSNHSSLSSETDPILARGLTVGDSITSNTSSVRSYFDENNNFVNPYGGGYRTYNSMAQDERLMSKIDGSRRSHSSSTSNRKGTIPPSFYNNNPQMYQAPLMHHRSQTVPDMMTNQFAQFKDDVNGMIDDYFQTRQPTGSQRGGMNHRYSHTGGYDNPQVLKTHLASKIDKLMEDLYHGAHQNQLR